MTPARVKRLARLARAQRVLADMSARTHVRLADAHAESAAEAGKIVEALNDESPLHGLLTDVMANALTRNAIDTARLNREREAAADAQRHEDVRADALDKRAREARRSLAKGEARRALEILIEEYAIPRR